MLKFVACSRVLKQVATCRSVIPFCPPSSVTSDQFINTSFGPLYSTHHVGEKRYYQVALDLLNRIPVTRKLMRATDRFLQSLNVQVVTPISKKEDADHLYVTIDLGVKRENVKVLVDHRTVFIEAMNDPDMINKSVEKYVCWVDLPDIDFPFKMFKANDIKAEYSNGKLKLIIPKLKKEDLVYYVNPKVTTV
ncbi:23.5 kDa heat shock protein, mitochondrial-like [Rutidosis leptorrhynchoides]|uniref:23.5 kDa heat shock protein, mitochondrial-like n=1 Tax=Rutidosis leptorrhynchoides TaxID=125765 RepID=UPI003A995E26